MMDGQVGVIRAALDSAGFHEIPILAYAAKYASAVYGPFRERGRVARPSSATDARTRWTRVTVARRCAEVALDLAEGADMVMVKPALAYLDVIADVQRVARRPGGRLPREW